MSRLSLMLTLGLVHFAAAATDLVGQATETRLPTLPARHDTLAVSYAGSVIGRGIMTWARHGREQLQVYAWLGAHEGQGVTDSLFSNPATLAPVREVRTVGDTTITVFFGRDTVFITTTVADRSETKWAVAPNAPMFSSASIESLAATMPFERGASRQLLTFYAPPSTLGVRRTTIRVEERESVLNRVAWRIVADTPGGGTTFWVDALTRTVLQSDVREGSAVITFRR
jgi:hypothetical protein